MRSNGKSKCKIARTINQFFLMPAGSMYLTSAVPPVVCVEPGTPPTLHECRALSAWLYQEQGGIDVVQLLGHLDYKMTAVYLSRRRREQANWRYIVSQPAAGGEAGGRAAAAVCT